jgi:hypothetical protein
VRRSVYDASSGKAGLWMAVVTAFLATVTLFEFRRAMAARSA